MKIITMLFLLTSLAFSKDYYSKVEPYELRTISSNVTGLVLYIDENSIGKKLDSKAFIKIDSQLDRDELRFTKQKLVYLKETVSLNKNILKNLEISLGKKRDNYKKIEALKIKSRVEKDREFYDLIGSENSYLNTQKEIINLKKQITDLNLRKAQLSRSINDKNLKAKGFILYSIDVKVGQVVTLLTPLATVADVSKALLTIYLDGEDVSDAKRSVIYINGEKTDYKIDRLLTIADTKSISKYMAQIIIKSPKVFSKLVKIELRKATDAN